MILLRLGNTNCLFDDARWFGSIYIPIYIIMIDFIQIWFSLCNLMPFGLRRFLDDMSSIYIFKDDIVIG